MYRSGFLNLPLLLTLMVSCVGGPKVSIRSDSSDFDAKKSENSKNFDCRSLITVVSPNKDKLMLQQLFEVEFTAQGFEVVSEAVAKRSLQMNVDRKENSERVSVSHVNQIDTAYIFRFSYLTRADFPHGEVAKTFAGNVVDLRSGRIAATVRYSQGLFGSTSAEDMVQEIVTTILQKLPCK